MDTRVKRKLQGKISDIVPSIVSNDLGSSKPVYIDETHNSYFNFGKDIAPFNKILELQGLSIPAGMNTKSAGYLFWETSEGYHFKSLDKLFSTEGKISRSILRTKKLIL